ncbi:hypothetical protein ACFWPX_35510 [Nocardia sp. NPDC058518]|uniref:hypothetical protein n=1 Tax=Nocardia sp. NPDC058518 TaxID=3346534 RepID=UPI00364854C8
MAPIEREDGIAAGVSGLVGAVYGRDAVADRLGRQVWERIPKFDPRFVKKAGPEFQGMPAFPKYDSRVGKLYGETLQRELYSSWNNHLLPGDRPVSMPDPESGKAYRPDVPALRNTGLFGRKTSLVVGESKTSWTPYPQQVALSKIPGIPAWLKGRPETKGYTPNQLSAFSEIRRGGVKLGPSRSTALDNALDDARKGGVLQAKPSPPLYFAHGPSAGKDNRWRNLNVDRTETARWGTHFLPTPRLAAQAVSRLRAEGMNSSATGKVVANQLDTVAEKNTPFRRAGGTAQWAASKVTGIPSRAGANFGSWVANTRPGQATVGRISTKVEDFGLKAGKSAPVSTVAKFAGSPVGKAGGKLLGPVGTALAINSDVKNGESVKKAVVTNGIGLGASIAAGAAVGTMIPVPVVGTVAGAVVGAGVGIVATGAAKKGWDWTAKKAKNLFGKKKMADGGPVFGAGSSIGDMIPAMLSHGEYVVNAASAGRFKPLLESINKGLPGFAPTGMNPAMSSVLEKASSGFGDAANAFVSGQSGDVMKTFGLKGTPAAMRAGTQATELLNSVGPQVGSLVGSAAKQIIPAKALVASGMAKGGAVDQSMTINLQTPDLDTAFQKSKTLEAQRALTYAGRW